MASKRYSIDTRVALQYYFVDTSGGTTRYVSDALSCWFHWFLSVTTVYRGCSSGVTTVNCVFLLVSKCTIGTTKLCNDTSIRLPVELP